MTVFLNLLVFVSSRFVLNGNGNKDKGKEVYALGDFSYGRKEPVRLRSITRVSATILACEDVQSPAGMQHGSELTANDKFLVFSVLCSEFVGFYL